MRQAILATFSKTLFLYLMKLPYLIATTVAAIGLMLTGTSCTPTEEGMLIGGALGAGVGGAVSDSPEGAILGGLVGAATGAVIGDSARDDHYYHGHGRGRGYGPPPQSYRNVPRNYGYGRNYHGRRGYGY